ncbi:MAG TPA: Hpt domain-containing protein, partial [Myxococcales bacterium]|nr:Hpt domain-containing protein [Myxococcales bacterium]
MVLDPMLEQLLPGFVEESVEICERATRSLLELERQPASGPRFDDLARALHTLKGSAATLGLAELSDFAHKMEDAVLPLRGSDQPLPPNLADAVLRSLDVWLAHLKATAARTEPPDLRPSLALLAKANAAKAVREFLVEKPTSEEPALQAQPVLESAPESGEASWRVATRQVTSLMREVERLREVRLRLDERRRELDRALVMLATPGIAAQTFEVRSLLVSARRALSSDGEEAADVVASMEDGLKSISTMPLRAVVEPLRRTVRDLCKSTGKEA